MSPGCAIAASIRSPRRRARPSPRRPHRAPASATGRPSPRIPSITTDEAVNIAREEGLARVDRVREGRRGWVIVGIDDNGDDMRIVISRTGEVVAVQRE